MTKNPRAFLTLAFTTPLLLAGDWRGELAAFQPKPGTSLTKSIEIAGDLELEETKLLLDGKDMSQAMPEMEMSMKTHQKLVVADTYLEVEDGRSRRLARTFETISSNSASSMSTQMGDQESDIDLESELEGLAVVFTFEDGGYRCAFAEGTKGDEKLLDGLEEDIDLRGFLAEGEMDEGETWKIPAEAVKALLLPGGDVKLRPSEGSETMPGMEAMNFSPRDMLSELEGTFSATFDGTRSENGVKVAILRLALDGSSANDLTERMQKMMETVEDERARAMKIDAFDGEMSFEAEGELLWNLEAGHVQGLTLSGELRMIVDMTMGFGDQEMELSQTFGGTQTITLTTSD
jgi:hypothetical protein